MGRFSNTTSKGLRVFRRRYCPALIIAITALANHQSATAVELYESDHLGNINQRNVGVYKKNRLDRAVNRAEIITRVKPLSAFSTLKIEIPVDIEYREIGNPRVEIEAPKDIIDKIMFNASGSKLIIDSHGFSSNGSIKLKLYGKDLRRVFVNSAADVELRDINVNEFTLSTRGAGDVSAQGSATQCVINALGASDLDLAKLRCSKVNLTVQGSADISLTALKSIKGRVQGAGDIEVLGNPSQRNLAAMGAYDIDYH